MSINLNSRILLSAASIAAAAALVVGATFAIFSDNETSTGNTFTAGSLDLKVDSESHYAGLTCTNGFWVEDVAGQSTRPDLIGDACDGTWTETDLGPLHKFFNLSDIKPGDDGEDTISLHVLSNDAWARLVINNVQDNENGCGGEEVAVDAACANEFSPDGELQDNLNFFIWVDQGETPGFQVDDLGEGDNVWQQDDEPMVVTPGTLNSGGETLNIWEGLAATWVFNGSVDSPGILQDGRMVGSTTYYFGLGWELPETVGNNVQTDSLVADMIFEAEQHRNNPTPFAP